MTHVLVIAKDAAIANSLATRLPNQVTTEAVSSPDEAKERFHCQDFDLVIYDAESLPSHRAKTLQLLAKRAHKHPGVRVIVVADNQPPHAPGFGMEEFEWIERPLDEAHMLAIVSAGLPGMSQLETSKGDISTLLSPTDFEGIMAISLPMRIVFQQVIETAAVDGSVLITGETGTGKDMVAAAIHKRSKRQHRPYVPVNMGAISHELIASELFGHEKGAFTGAHAQRLGRIEMAQGGTLLLDEIGELPLSLQVKLLRFLQEQDRKSVV